MKLYLTKTESGVITLRAERQRNGRFFSTHKSILNDRNLVSRETQNLVDGLHLAMATQPPLGIDGVNGGLNDGS